MRSLLAATRQARLRTPALTACARDSSNLARIKEVRERSGAPMHEVKSALVATAWDIDAALEELRSRGHLAASKKAARVAAEGLIGVASSATAAVLVELNCETDFVARNPKFQALIAGVAASALKVDYASLQPSGSAVASLSDELMQALPLEQGGSASQAVTALAAEVRENVKMRQIRWLAGPNLIFGAYAHGGPSRSAGRIGSLVALHAANVTEDKARGDIQQFAAQLAMHVAASDPQYLSRETMPAAVVDAQRAAYESQAATSGKPADIAGKMVDGWMKKWQSETCLLHQNYIMNDSVTVQAAINEVAKAAGTPLTLVRFARLRVGAGIEKQEKDFAAEVAAAAA